MNSAVLTAIVVAALTGSAIPAWLSYRQAQKAAVSASRSEVLKIEAEAYARSRRALEATIDQLQEQLTLVWKDQATLRELVIKERDRADRQQNVSADLRAQIQQVSQQYETRLGDMQRLVNKLRNELARAGVNVHVIDDES